MRTGAVRAGRALLGALSLGVVAVVGAESDAERVAVHAALDWLALIDRGAYAESWQGASTYFRGAITQTGWAASLRGVRAPLGAMRSRQPRTTKEAGSLPGAPDGHYVVMEFSTSFAHKATAIETVTFLREPDGRWRAAGYLIR
jgi:hypothetical protein